MIGTLNHIVVTGILWLKRFATHPADFRSLAAATERDTPGALDAIVHEDIHDLRALRDGLDTIIDHWTK